MSDRINNPVDAIQKALVDKELMMRDKREHINDPYHTGISDFFEGNIDGLIYGQNTCDEVRDMDFWFDEEPEEDGWYAIQYYSDNDPMNIPQYTVKRRENGWWRDWDCGLHKVFGRRYLRIQKDPEYETLRKKSVGEITEI